MTFKKHRKKARTQSIFCRTHGGGVKCTEPGCEKFSRLRGKCSKHGGVQLCNYKQCTQKAQLSGKCRSHIDAAYCDFENCTRLAVNKGFCGQHGGEGRCKHAGCEREVLTNKDAWCDVHLSRLEELRQYLDVQRKAGYAKPCQYYNIAKCESCPETALEYTGYCPEHTIYSSCGASPTCSKRAVSNGKCAEHAGLLECVDADCSRLADPGGRCREHGRWAYYCSDQYCFARVPVGGMACSRHGVTDFPPTGYDNASWPRNDTSQLDTGTAGRTPGTGWVQLDVDSKTSREPAVDGESEAACAFAGEDGEHNRNYVENLDATHYELLLGSCVL